jgi:hydrogenase maturation protease
MSRLAIFGIGNVLAQDDAVGPTVIHWLNSRYSFPPDVVVEDLGTPALELPTHLAGHRHVIFIDAVASSSAEPGTVKLYDREELISNPPGLRLTPHDPALTETLLILDIAGGAPGDVKMVGVVAGETEMALGLSDAVRNAVPLAAAVVLELAERVGVVAELRADASDAVPWWEAA